MHLFYMGLGLQGGTWIAFVCADAHCASMPQKGQTCWSVLLINAKPKYGCVAVNTERNQVTLFYSFFLTRVQSNTFKTAC